ncbi:hypothetical protein ACM66B_003094 [Microbotryomycetes sp. NB124-2]
MPGERKLTKKEKKAQAFRANKGKGKSASSAVDGHGEDGEVQDVPETDLIAEDEQPREREQEQQQVKKESKKRKRQEQDADTTQTEEEAANGEAGATPSAEDAAAPKKKRQRGLTKTQQLKKRLLENPEDGKKSRLVVFVGNMPYDVTVDQIKEHFSSCGEEPQVRLLTPQVSKYDKNKPITKSKGCAFVEFTQATSLQSALKKHGTEMGTRKINVELTAGGGGNSDQRKKKIQDKRKMLSEEREKAAKNKKIRNGEPVVEKVDGVRQWGKQAGEGEQEAEQEDSTKPKTTVREIISKDGYRKKVRDRRLQKKEEKKAKKAIVAQKHAGAKQARGSGGGGGGGAKAKMPWMTGANAVKLG